MPSKVSSAAGQTSSRGGRPRLLDPAMDAMIRCHMGATTDRAVLDNWYRLRAMNVLRSLATEFEWLFNLDRMKAGDDAAWKPELLGALGRISDDVELLARARQLCSVRPSVKVGLSIIKSGVVPATAEHSSALLRRTILNSVDNYRRRHPGVAEQEIREALLACGDNFAP